MGCTGGCTDFKHLSNSPLFKVTEVLINTEMSSKESHDPGWNDPPVFTFDKAAAIQAAAANKKRMPCNKRVAFPISNNLENQQKNIQSNSPSAVDLSKPPLMTRPPSFLTPCAKLEVESQVENETSSSERLEKVLENLKIKSNCDEEIIKRIKVLEKMWTDGKIEESVQYKIYKLSEALCKGDMDTADHIQMGLMVDYASQCSSWMSGIRQLINLEKNNLDLNQIN